MFGVKLDGWGHAVDVDAIYASETYGGMLEGLPTAELNERLATTRVQETVAKLWGDGRHVHVIPPKVAYLRVERGMALASREPTANPKLPPVRVVAWLSSWKPVRDPDEHGSHAFVAWFQDDGDVSPARVQGALAGLDWRAVARDFSL